MPTAPVPSDPRPDELPEPLLRLLADLLGCTGAAREQELQRLQAMHPEHAAALGRAAADLAAADRLLDRGFAVAEDEPVRLGPYEVVRRLGEGAFGEVFLCRQAAPIERHVAVKVLRPGVADRHMLARFSAERQLLAALQHPAIAQVLDAGSR